jgi:hypothetical protein
MLTHQKPFHSLFCHCDVSPLLSLFQLGQTHKHTYYKSHKHTYDKSHTGTNRDNKQHMNRALHNTTLHCLKERESITLAESISLLWMPMSSSTNPPPLQAIEVASQRNGRKRRWRSRNNCSHGYPEAARRGNEAHELTTESRRNWRKRRWKSRNNC